MARFLIILCLAVCARAAEDDKINALAQFSGALERLAATVAPAVVQVQVSSWCASTPSESAASVASCRIVGSGVIVDPSGYIITNEHVVRNARHIHVMLTPKSDRSADSSTPADKQQSLDAVIVGANRQPVGKRQVLDAIVVGSNRDSDIALLKIEASGLPIIPIRNTGKSPRQGQIVVAVGSPEGLDNTMTIGIVSAVGRQPYPDFPMVYIQTDAAINPGNSGGPLLDVDGELIGINTFMLNDNGRNQGLGFAVPAAVVRYVYEQLRTSGVVRQSLFGVQVQTVTPAVAQGLGLSRGYGIMISDVLPGSPAESAGLRSRDIITTVDGAAVSTLPYYTALMYLHDPTIPVAVSVLRGEQTLQFQVPAVAVGDRDYREIGIDPRESPIAELGIFGRNVNASFAMRNGLRSRAGVYVVATTAGNEDSGTGLARGDVVASFNGVTIHDMQELRTAIHEQTPDMPAILQIERNGRYFYVERELPEQSGADRAGRAVSKSDPDRTRR